MKIRIEGLHFIPDAPSIIASKHQSALDTIIMLKIFGYPTYILKQELLKLPFFGYFLKRMQMIAIDRSLGPSSLKKIIKESKIRLAEQRHIIIYPEGTRTKPGTTRKYNPGVYALYKYCNAKIIPVALNTGLNWPKMGIIKKPGTVTVKFLEAIPENLNQEEFLNKLEKVIEANSNALLKGH